VLDKVVLRNADSWLNFEQPLTVLIARHPSEVLPVLIEAETRVNEDNLHAAGFVAYEAASGFDSAFTTNRASGLPLVCLGLFKEMQSRSDLETFDDHAWVSLPWKMTESSYDYFDKLSAIRRQIELGNTYQINYTTRQRVENVVDPWQLFLKISRDVSYAAYVDCQDHVIISASPELFFHLDGDQLKCKPMKGTAPRGMTTVTDLAMREELFHSAKNRAENVMITDMVRNDLGRIAKTGSVRTEALFEIQKLQTVWQMTSSVSAVTSASVSEIFKALFPCASVTGAPKVSSMAIIAELEDTPRGIYTGAIGFIGPDRQAKFSVAIRTAVVDKKTNAAAYGVGGGIVWDSEPAEEYRECLSKARILSAPHVDTRDFELLETMLWTPEDGFFLLDKHLNRMQSSAVYFDFECDPVMIESALLKLAQRFRQHRHRVRLLLRRDGQFQISESLQTATGVDQPIRLVLARDPIDQNDPFLYHKTTQRDSYDRALRVVDGADDVLLWNEDGDITETTIANVIVNMDGELLTPPVDCGLLGGTYRDYMLSAGQVKERRIKVSEINSSTEIMLINSVRGAYSACVSE
jgi:para-aminobenzoate synthetase/4-amino-4-deoxychorismate lyase